MMFALSHRFNHHTEQKHRDLSDLDCIFQMSSNPIEESQVNQDAGQFFKSGLESCHIRIFLERLCVNSNKNRISSKLRRPLFEDAFN